MTNQILIFLLVCSAGFFDGVMDMIKDFKYSEKNWLWKWVEKHPKYKNWYDGQYPLPFFKTYRPGIVWLSDAWHMAKHFMLLSFAGAIAINLGFEWYWNLLGMFIIYVLEGEIFNLVYQRLKQ